MTIVKYIEISAIGFT